jgi:hypothetical protein
LCRTLAFGCGGAAVAAAAALEMRADTLRLIGFERARMRLGVRYSHFEQYVQNRLALNFELSCQIVDANFTHPSLYVALCLSSLS